MMIPEPWENNQAMDPRPARVLRFHASLMEPWDGPALIAFTDGTVIGAVLDRNGLRPGRYWVTDDGLVVLASEVGVLDIDPARVVRKGRLQPGRMFLVDTAAGRIIEDEEVKAGLAAEHPYADWLHAGLVHLDDLPDRDPRTAATARRSLTQQQLFGYTEEELRVVLAPMARTGAEPHRLDGHRHPAGGRCPTGPGCSSTTSPSCSPRSPIRRWTRSGRSWSPRLALRPARSTTCFDPGPGLLPAGRAALPGDQQRRPGQDHAHQPRRRPAGLRRARGRRPLLGRGRRRALRRGWPRSGPR